MPQLWVQITLFLSSYLPLFALVGVRSVGRSDAIARLCAVLAGLAIIGTAAFLCGSYRRNTITVKIVEVDSRDADVAAYAATYLLPFVTVFTGAWQDVVSLGGFVAVLGVIYVRSRLIYVNPTLSLLGYHLTRVIYTTPGADDADRPRWPRYVLSRRQGVAVSSTIRAHEVSPDLLVFAERLDG
jgi:hypothetical protein